MASGALSDLDELRRGRSATSARAPFARQGEACCRPVTVPSSCQRVRAFSRSSGKSRANSSGHGARISGEYLAGFVDAEGSLMIAKFRAASPGKWYHRARASLDNVDGQALREIQRTYGGIPFRQRRRKSGWRVVYKLVWTGDRTERLLHPILPHLRVKRKQAELLLRFIQHRSQTSPRRMGTRATPLPDQVVALREGFHARMRELNARGPR